MKFETIAIIALIATIIFSIIAGTFKAQRITVAEVHQVEIIPYEGGLDDPWDTAIEAGLVD